MSKVFRKSSLDKMVRMLGVEPVVIVNGGCREYTVIFGSRRLRAYIGDDDNVYGVYVNGCLQERLVWAFASLCRQTVRFGKWQVEIGWDDNGVYGRFGLLPPSRTRILLDPTALSIVVASATARYNAGGSLQHRPYDIIDSPENPFLVIDYLTDTSEEFRRIFLS